MIRAAHLDDVAGIATIHVKAWQTAYRGLVPDAYLAGLSIARRQLDWQRFLAAPGSDVFVDEEEGQLRGWINVGESRDGDAAPGTAELWAIYVDPDHWSRGVGQRLWLHARAALERQGHAQVTLWVLEGNDRALRFYGRAGFSPDEGVRQTIERAGKTLVELRYRTALRL